MESVLINLAFYAEEKWKYVADAPGNGTLITRCAGLICLTFYT
jgi:hypothetical protein